MEKTYIMIKCTKEEKLLLKKMAKENHLTLSAYIRLVCFNKLK